MSVSCMSLLCQCRVVFILYTLKHYFNNNYSCLGPVAKVSGQVTQGQGCAVWDATCNPCCSVKNILMKNCTSYNVYYLKPPLGHAAYCLL